MRVRPNTIMLAVKGQAGVVREIDVQSAVFLHRRGHREAGRITIDFHTDEQHGRLTLERKEGAQFEGALCRARRETEQPVDGVPMRCVLCDSLEQHALLLGVSPWLEEGQEFEWAIKLDSVRRLTHQAPPSP